MHKFYPVFILIFLQFINSHSAMGYPLPITRFSDDGAVYIQSESIVRSGNMVTLMYVENFNQPQSYGELTYSSKATGVRIDCPDRRVFALSEAFYSGGYLTGNKLGSFPLNDEFGSYAEHGSWVSEVVRLGCST